MNDMVVKSVDLMGDTVMAAQDTKGNIWAGVGYFCNALGMNKAQKDRQIRNIKKDEALSEGCSRLAAGVFDKDNETYALRLDYIPLWLAKISITDKTKKDNPELAKKLLKYQLKAKDILAEAFMPKQSMPQTTDDKIQLLAQGHTELKAEVDSIREDLEALKMDLPIFPVEAEKITTAVKKKGVVVMGGKQSPAYLNRSLQHKVYTNIYANLKYNFGGIKSYKSLKRSQCDKALEIINAYEPPLFLTEQIAGENAQQSLGFGKDGARA